ncbi:LamB/YcsF family protein [Aeromicrobium marinum DSM 15272]|uniref:LamB/YcsF family protein n=1 Tax=Aeromicrobium marinum DSM 15272 TaxID=585531 RepID=E2SG17_9ACTN|nr:5-oxoprolinase subunit PxpA [Aeromicrobium marinum]EFQ81774.1 LamB/YcsF family protein [Aeromicrobium marinum DSM 15272]
MDPLEPPRVDLNADLGESVERWESGEDLALLDVVTSANVCCGAYAGDEGLMFATCLAAAERGVAIGAQVGYPDREGFGRRPQDPDHDELVRQVREQVDLLAEIADETGATVAYVKPHGALYHAVTSDEAQSAAVVEAVAPYGLPLLGLPHALALSRARAEGLPVVVEGFADRAYTPSGDLVPRSDPGAVLHDRAAVAAQAVRLLGTVDSICLHSDSPGAVDLAGAVRAALERAGATIGPFA